MGERLAPRDEWAVGSGYEDYIGRWSRLIAPHFLRSLAVPPHRRWLDVGCGTGALMDAIARQAVPDTVMGIDRSEAFVAHARAHVSGARATFAIADAQALPVADGAFDAVVSALVLNFAPDPARMAREMVRATGRGGVVALYVWDYAAGMQLIRRFWDAAKALDPGAAALDEATRFPCCEPARLEEIFASAGLSLVETRAFEVPTRFRDFDDYWSPFLRGQGPAPSYAMSLSEDRRLELRELIRRSAPLSADGSLELVARAWAVRGTAPGGGSRR